jgi:hypothetical protein
VIYLTEKQKNTYYLEPETVKEMRREAVELDIKYPSAFIRFLWEFYKRRKGE